MNREESQRGSTLYRRLLLVGSVLVLFLLLITRVSCPTTPATQARVPPQPVQGARSAEPDYITRQTAAMRPGFGDDLALVERAPYYTLAANVNPEEGIVDGQMSVLYTNRTGGALSEVLFRLYPNADTIYGGGSLTVQEVTQEGENLETRSTQGGTTLEVVLAQPLAAGEQTTLNLTFVAEVPYRSGQGYGIYNRTSNLITLAGWYPVLARHAGGWQTPDVPLVGDALLAETSLYEVDLTVPAGYQVVATGVVQEQEENTAEGLVTWRMVSGPAREFSVAISDRFETLETEVAGVTVRVHTLPAGSAVTTGEEALELAAHVFEVYSRRFGAYPYTEVDVVDAPVNIGGYEFPGMVFMEHAQRVSGSYANYQYLLAHELAHQWWYGLVGSHTVQEPWLDESLATYAIAIFRESEDAYGSGENLVGHWRSRYGNRRASEPPVDSSALDFRGWGSYRQTVYIHGALFLHELRQELGDEAFFALLQRHLADHRYDVATTESFLDLAEESAGRELDTLYDKWFGSPSNN
ncbi:MAG: M1 family metallopeptidase [Anaerolineales bacterium]